MLDAQKLQALLGEMKGWAYGYGYKIEPVQLQGSALVGMSASGEKGERVDCSGFTRWAIWHAAGELWPDGSANQHAFVAERYPLAAPSDAHGDGVFACFLAPAQTSDGIGHVLLVAGGMTFESNGEFGPTSQPWDSASYHHLMACYRLD